MLTRDGYAPHQKDQNLCPSLSAWQIWKRPSKRANIETSDLHKLKKSEDRILSTLDAINDFMGPFTEGNECFYCISSGTPIPSEIEQDVMNAEVIGEETRQIFC